MIGFLMVAVLFIYLEWRERVAKGCGGIKTASTSEYVAGEGFHLYYPERGGARPRGFDTATAAAHHNLVKKMGETKMVAKGTNDMETAHDKIARFLADKLAKADAEQWVPWLVTDVKEISRHTGIDEKVVKTYLLKREKELMDKRVALARAGGTYAVIKLANPREGR